MNPHSAPKNRTFWTIDRQRGCLRRIGLGQPAAWLVGRGNGDSFNVDIVNSSRKDYQILTDKEGLIC